MPYSGSMEVTYWSSRVDSDVQSDGKLITKVVPVNRVPVD